MTLSRRKFMKVAGVSALGSLVAGTLPNKVLAHEDGEAMDLYMGELYFRLEEGEKNAPITLEAEARHLIRLINEGGATHEIHFGRDADLVEPAYKEDLLGTEGEHGAHGFMAVVLEPGEAATMMFVIPETKKGEWEVGCFMTGHYEGGQRAPLIVA